MTKNADERVPSVHLGLSVPATLGDQIAAIAQREHNGKSAVIRRLLTDAVQREQAVSSDGLRVGDHS